MTAAAVEPASDAGLLAGDRRPLTIGIILLITLVGFEALAAATAFPVVLHELGHVNLYGWTFSAFLLANLVGITVAGQQSDRHGPRRPLVVGAVLFAIGLVIVGAAPSMLVVVAGRFVQGLGAGALPAVVYVVIGRAYPASARPKMFATLSSAWVLPSLIGPAIAGAVAEHLSWRLVFVGILPILALALALSLPALGALDRQATGDDDGEARSRATVAIRLAFGAGLVLAGLGTRSFVAIPLVVVGALLAAPALRRLVPKGTLRAAPGVPAAIAVRGLLTFPFFGADAFLPLMLTSVRHLSPTRAGLALTVSGLSWTLGSWIQARGASRVTIRRFGVLGISLVVVGIAGIAVALSSAVPAAVAWAAWGVGGLGMGMAYSMPSLVVLGDAPPDEVGAITASLQLTDTLGMALGTGVGGSIVAFGAASGWARSTSIGLVDALMVAVGIVAVVAARRLPRRHAADAVS
jgi:MFS family permease